MTTVEHTNQEKILQASNSHAIFSLAILDMFKWFQEAVAGYRAEMDFEVKFNQVNEMITADQSMPVMLMNQWMSYVKSLRSAYGNFGLDVVTRHGFDEPAQVRNLALSIAGNAFNQSRFRARELLVSQIEGAFLPS